MTLFTKVQGQMKLLCGDKSESRGPLGRGWHWLSWGDQLVCLRRPGQERVFLECSLWSLVPGKETRAVPHQAKTAPFALSGMDDFGASGLWEWGPRSSSLSQAELG